MGKEILYCNKCGKQLGGDDFTRGRAHTFDNRQYCTRCLPQRFETPRPAPPPSSSSSSRITRRSSPSSVQLQVQGTGTAPKASRSGLYLSLAVAGVVIVLLLGLILSPSAVPPPPPPPAPVAAPPPPDPRKLAEELKELEAKIQERLQAEQFAAAVDVLEEAKKRQGSAEWTTAVSNRIKEVQESANRLYPDLKAKAVTAQTKGDSARVTELRTRLAAWGRKDFAADFEATLTSIIPREPVPAGAVVLFRFPNEPGRPSYRPYGTMKDGALAVVPYSKQSSMGGFESLKEHIVIPAEGELWLTYSTNSPKPMNLRFRVVRGDKTSPYNVEVKNPEVGRPARFKVPLLKFMDYGNKLISKDDRVSTIYIEHVDPKSDLTFYELVIFRTKE